MPALHKTKELVKKLPRVKPHLDYLAALLTIPVLITAIILNVGNLQKGKANTAPTPTTTQQVSQGGQIEYVKVSSSPQPTSAPGCTPGIGQVTIAYPQEGDTINVNPVCIDIAYQSQNHCSVQWQYRINGGSWSDYSTNSVCLYNLPTGQVNYDLQVQSLSNSDTQIIHRTFQYAQLNQPMPTNTPMPTMPPTPAPQTPTPVPSGTQNAS